jgi:hypothetical protein
MTVIQLLVAASIGLSLWFVVSLGNPRRSESPTMAWLLSAWAWVTVAFETLLLLALFRIHVPAWLAAVVLFAQDGIFAWRLVLLRRTRRVDRSRVGRHHEGS